MFSCRRGKKRPSKGFGQNIVQEEVQIADDTDAIAAGPVYRNDCLHAQLVPFTWRCAPVSLRFDRNDCEKGGRRGLSGECPTCRNRILSRPKPRGKKGGSRTTARHPNPDPREFWVE